MSEKITNIGDLLEVRPHPTVVRLTDLEAESADWLTDSFLITAEIKAHLQALRQLLKRKQGGGAFLIGHYGSGKSHFLSYLTQQLRSGQLVSGSVQVIPISLVNFSATNRLEDIVCSALGIEVDSGDRRLAWDTLQPDATLLVLDELSEFLRSKSDAQAFNEDVRFLQFIGEWSMDRSFWILAAMQEGIEHTGELEHSLYRKIKDRYPLRLLLTPAHVQTLIADSILIKKPGYQKAVRRLGQQLRESFPSLSLDLSLLQSIYPLHPATLTLLEEIRDRFSQTRGVVDFVVTSLRGDPTRGVEPFLNQPWGALITPDMIVDHFLDLFELQPEFIGLAQQVFPWYRQHLDKLFEKSALRTLAQRVLKLLVLVHLSPARDHLSASEAASWLLFSATRVEPTRNLKIIEKILRQFADQGRFVSSHGGGYRLELNDDGSAAFETQLKREMGELRGQSTLILELLVPLLPEGGFNPFTLPREQYQHRLLRWRFHERGYAVWSGETEPQPEEAEIRLCIRLPWGEASAAVGCYTLIPLPIQVNEDLLELAALSRIQAHPLGIEHKKRLMQRIQSRVPMWQNMVRNAWLEAALVTPEGQRETPPRFNIKGPPDSWLEVLALWVLRRTWPRFERFAPAHGPLPKAAWRQLMRFTTDADLLSEHADEYVMLIREAYLVPMGLLRRKGREYIIPRNLEKHELIAMITPLLEHNPSPQTIAEHLSNPIYGLVPDQTRAILVFLLLQGELDIIKQGVSYRDSFETLPNLLQYDKVVPGNSLSSKQLQAIELLCTGLNIPIPRQWSVLAQRRIARLAQIAAAELVNRMQSLADKLQSIAQSEGLWQRLRSHLAIWKLLTEDSDVLQGLQQFLYEAGSVQAHLAETTSFTSLEERLARLLTKIEFYRYLLQHPALAESQIVSKIEALGEMPTLEQVDELDSWLQQAGVIYADYKSDYQSAHERWWQTIDQHPLWQWQASTLAHSQHIGLGQQLAVIASYRKQALAVRCRGLVNLDYQPICSCGFDGESAPISEQLQAFEELSGEIDEQIRLFFQQKSVKARLGEWQQQGLEPGSSTSAYLEGLQPIPEIADIKLLDQHLAGLNLVKEVDDSVVLELLGQRAWKPTELLQKLEQLFTGLGARRIRFRETKQNAAISETVISWCGQQAARYGTPLPKGLGQDALRIITEQLRADEISTAMLQRLDDIGLDRAGRKCILSWLLEGQISLPKERLMDSSVLCAIQLLHNRSHPTTPTELATISATAYRHSVSLRPLAGTNWADWLNELAEIQLAEVLPLPEALKQYTSSQWLLIDCLGLPLLEPLQQVIEKVFSAWKQPVISFAEVSSDTSTDGCYRLLLDAGINHPLEKIDVVDEQVHAATADFDELVARVTAELIIAAKQLLPRLDPGKPLLIFADHGFRMNTDGKGYSHGGDSTLERLVPLWYCSPHGS
ncbi:MAG: ATP-binding protein [Xanthomonadales bacterium]|nr:ATP-binding protein [Xanthomonadales bacterium]